MSQGEPVIVARTWKDSEARVIESLLGSYSIPCLCSSRIPRNIYPLAMEAMGEFRIYVPGALAAYARRVLEDHRRKPTHLRLVE